MFHIMNLVDTKFSTIHESFQNAFSDYAEPFDLSIEELKYMVERRSYNPEYQFGAFDGNVLVGFILNGISTWQGKRTVYDTGTGVIKEYRKQGVATKLFEETLSKLKLENVEQYLLEVIRSNKNAYDLYSKSRFSVTREFEYYITEKSKLKFPNQKLNKKKRLRQFVIFYFVMSLLFRLQSIGFILFF